MKRKTMVRSILVVLLLFSFSLIGRADIKPRSAGIGFRGTYWRSNNARPQVYVSDRYACTEVDVGGGGGEGIGQIGLCEGEGRSFGTIGIVESVGRQMNGVELPEFTGTCHGRQPLLRGFASEQRRRFRNEVGQALDLLAGGGESRQRTERMRIAREGTAHDAGRQ